MLALQCSVDGKHFENGTLRKPEHCDNHVIPFLSLPLTQIHNDQWLWHIQMSAVSFRKKTFDALFGFQISPGQ